MSQIVDWIGRREELAYLAKLYSQNRSQMIVVYGRRRIGKSTLLEHFCKNKSHLFLTGKKSEKEQDLMGRFLKELSITLTNPLIARLATDDWGGIFELLDGSHKKLILVLDEFQWMCTRQSVLISTLQEFWDKKWKDNKRIFLVLCGSVISFMKKNVLSEKSPLYGRRTASFELEALPPSESRLFFPKKSDSEICQILMTWGGVPCYLKLIDAGESFAQNINRLALTKDAYFVNEVQFILREQLKSFARYSLLLGHLARQPLSREDIAENLGISNSGSLDHYLKNLQDLQLIKMVIPITKPDTTKMQRYVLWDEYLRFYYTFIFPNTEQIQYNNDDWLFDKIVAPAWDVFCGYSFELFCRKNMKLLIRRLDIEKVFKRSGTFWQRGTRQKPGLEIDMVIERTDHVTHLIECKWSTAKIGSSIIDEMRTRKNNYPNPLGHTLKTALITTHGVTHAVEESGVFDNIVTLKDFLRSLPP